MTEGTLKGREQCRPVLEAEVKRWSAKSHEQLVTELSEVRAYEVVFNSGNYQVEVQLLENTDRYVHVLVSVDDGSIRASFRPLSSSFICEKRHVSDGRIANDERPTTNQRPLP